MKPLPCPCPFCGHKPIVGPLTPDTEGTAWAYVKCSNILCPARPIVLDVEGIADNRGSDLYKMAAIKRWNIRF